MQIATWPVARITPYDKNPRVNDAAVDAVAASIKEFGFRQPIVVDEEGVIIVGHASTDCWWEIPPVARTCRG
jgi:ParB-like chromosome segregation protein Spo0J